MKHFTSRTQKIGEIGEKIAEMFLVKHGFYIIEKNFTHKLGEIDIIAEKDHKIYFFEVKSVVGKNSENITPQGSEKNNVTRETYINNVSRVANTGIRQNVSKNDRETPVKHIKSRIETDNRQVKDMANDEQNVLDAHNFNNSVAYNRDIYNVSREIYNPFQNMSYSKMKKFTKVVEIYLLKRHISRETKWQIDGLGVVLFKHGITRKIFGQVARIEHVVIE